MNELAYRSKFSVSNKNREVRLLERSLELMNAKINVQDTFAVKFALRHTRDMHAVYGAQPPSHACMKGAGFKISRLDICCSSMWYQSIQGSMKFMILIVFLA